MKLALGLASILALAALAVFVARLIPADKGHSLSVVYVVSSTPTGVPAMEESRDPRDIALFLKAVSRFPSNDRLSRAVERVSDHKALIADPKLITGTGSGDAIHVRDNLWLFQSGELGATMGDTGIIR